jgi:concanavalin A-like lectin/glucanase superfamily protein
MPASYLTLRKLEFSRDPLSDVTPAWIDLTTWFLGGDWADGKQDDLAEPQAGTATFRLWNQARRFEPEQATGAYYPDIKPLRRFRLTLSDGTTTTQQGVWYATSWDVTYPHGTNYSEVVVQCVDGFGLLSLDALDLLDPPAAATFGEVVASRKPFGYWPLADLRDATKIAAEAGPEGTYVARTKLVIGEDNAPVVGDQGTSVSFLNVGSGSAAHGSIPMSSTEWLADSNTVSVHALIRPSTVAAGNMTIVAGPRNTTAAEPIWQLLLANDAVQFLILDTTAPTFLGGGENPSLVSRSADTWYSVLWVYDKGTTRTYVDGELVNSDSTRATLLAPTSGQPMRIGSTFTTDDASWRGHLSHIAVFESALSEADAQALYQAARGSGFVGQTAGERIAAVADSALWAETGIQAGTHMVRAVMEHGQSRLAEITAAVKAEMPDSQFFFDGSGNPTYLAWNYKDGLGSSATFGHASGEVPYENIGIAYDDNLFNEVTVGHESEVGEETQHTETDASSVSEFYRRAHSETGLILTEHHDAVAVAAAILETHSQPRYRATSLTLSGADATARTQILTREIGDMVRVKHRGEGAGLPIDIGATILGRAFSLDEETGHLTCTWTLSRGFDAAAGVWRIGIAGWTELQTATALG